MKRCLIVDDSQVVRRVLYRILDEAGFECIESDHGEGAYDECRKQMPDLIMLDWNMPDMDGLEFLEKLRKTAGGDTPRVIICSTENEENRLRHALGYGADEYVMKPFDRAVILSKLALLGLSKAV